MLSIRKVLQRFLMYDIYLLYVQIKKSLNLIKQLKNDLENNYNNVLKAVAKNLVKPDNLKK